METEPTVNTQTNTINQTILPNAGGVLAMGILSLVFQCCIPIGIASIVLGVLAIVYGNKAINIYDQNPEKFTQKSMKNAKAGRVCGIIGLSLGGAWLIGVILYLSAIGWTIGSVISNLPWDTM